jgi:hypothetical protein
MTSCQTVGLRREDAELLVYLVDEEKDIYMGVLVVVCHPLSRVQPNPQLPRRR